MINVFDFLSLQHLDIHSSFITGNIINTDSVNVYHSVNIPNITFLNSPNISIYFNFPLISFHLTLDRKILINERKFNFVSIDNESSFINCNQYYFTDEYHSIYLNIESFPNVNYISFNRYHSNNSFSYFILNSSIEFSEEFKIYSNAIDDETKIINKNKKILIHSLRKINPLIRVLASSSAKPKTLLILLVIFGGLVIIVVASLIYICFCLDDSEDRVYSADVENIFDLGKDENVLCIYVPPEKEIEDVLHLQIDSDDDDNNKKVVYVLSEESEDAKYHYYKYTKKH
jgi:hypothetical protein